MQTGEKTAKDKNEKPGVARGLFLAASDVDVTLTYDWAPEPIVFPCVLLLNADQSDFRQKFYAQPAADVEKGLHNYHVEMLAKIGSRPPSGLPGFAELAAECDGDFRAAIKAYLGGGEPRAVRIAQDAIEMFNRVTQPREFFR